MPSKLAAFMVIALTAILAACQSTRILPSDPSLDNTNSSLLTVYRPSQMFDSMNPEKPYVYLDDRHIGNLGTGDTVSIRVKTGQHRIAMRRAVLFAPAWQIGAIDVEVQPGKHYYVRYSYDMAGVIGTNVTGSSSLNQVNEATGMARR